MTDSAPHQPLPWHRSPWHQVLNQWRQDRLPHALMLAGPPGVGKARFARALAALLLCERPLGGEEARACGDCKQCRLLAADTHGDLHWLAPESGQWIKVDAVRQVSAQLARSPQVAARKLVVVDTANRLNINAANALLKTLEEPTDDAVLLLVHQEGEPLLPTIRSRCQVQRLAPPADSVAASWLQAESAADASDCQAALRQHPGSPLRALAALKDDRLALTGQCLDALKGFLKKELTTAEAARPFLSLGLDASLVLMLGWLNDMARLASTAEVEVRYPEARAVFGYLVRHNPPQRVHQLAAQTLEARSQLAYNLNPELVIVDRLMAWRELMPGSQQVTAPGPLSGILGVNG